MNFSWIRNLFFVLALCVAGIATPSLAAEQQAVTAQAEATHTITVDQAKTTYTFTVDHDQTLKQIIALGHYDWRNGAITSERFPVQGRGKQQVVAEIVTIDRFMSSEEVLAEITRRGLRPATLVELLTFGAAFPEEQRKYPIIALGSVAEVRGRRCVPDLYGAGAKRFLGLDWWDDDWAGLYRFLAVRK